MLRFLDRASIQKRPDASTLSPADSIDGILSDLHPIGDRGGLFPGDHPADNLRLLAGRQALGPFGSSHGFYLRRSSPLYSMMFMVSFSRLETRWPYASAMAVAGRLVVTWKRSPIAWLAYLASIRSAITLLLFP